MNILIILDPLPKLNFEWDNSLAVGGELILRGHCVWLADAPDLWAENNRTFVRASKLLFFPSKSVREKYRAGVSKIWEVAQMDLVMNRKEPPVNAAYLAMTYLLDGPARKIPVINRPAAVRNHNEKLSILNFPKWIPPTLVSSKETDILAFRKKHGEIVIKPLDQKGGLDVFLMNSGSNTELLRTLLLKGNPVMAQKRILSRAEKRIVLMNGKLLCAYEKRPQGKEWRANLDLGATFHTTELSTAEKSLIREMKPFLIREGLYLVGLDVLGEKLIEINVTSPAGPTEAQFLSPHSKPVSAWADFVERFSPS